MEITRDFLRALRTDIGAALDQVAAKHGVAISMGGASFTASSATIKVIVAAEPEEGETAVNSIARQHYTVFAIAYGAKPEWLGKTFESKGRIFTVAGLLPSRRSNPILCTRDDGKGFVFPVDSIASRMK